MEDESITMSAFWGVFVHTAHKSTLFFIPRLCDENICSFGQPISAVSTSVVTVITPHDTQSFRLKCISKNPILIKFVKISLNNAKAFRTWLCPDGVTAEDGESCLCEMLGKCMWKVFLKAGGRCEPQVQHHHFKFCFGFFNEKNIPQFLRHN